MAIPDTSTRFGARAAQQSRGQMMGPWVLAMCGPALPRTCLRALRDRGDAVWPLSTRCNQKLERLADLARLIDTDQPAL